MSLRDVLLLINSGKEAQFTIRFIEGSRLKDWQSIFEQAPNLRLLHIQWIAINYVKR